MSDYTRVVLETDLKGRRVNLSALDDRGAGHGYRLTGPKFRDVAPSDNPHTVDLEGRDASALIEYGALLSRLALGDREPAMDALMDAARHFLDVARTYHHPDRESWPAAEHWAQTYDRRRVELRDACLAVADALTPAAAVSSAGPEGDHRG